jgi:hypothetical protein
MRVGKTGWRRTRRRHRAAVPRPSRRPSRDRRRRRRRRPTLRDRGRCPGCRRGCQRNGSDRRAHEAAFELLEELLLALAHVTHPAVQVDERLDLPKVVRPPAIEDAVARLDLVDIGGRGTGAFDHRWSRDDLACVSDRCRRRIGRGRWQRSSSVGVRRPLPDSVSWSMPHLFPASSRSKAMSELVCSPTSSARWGRGGHDRRPRAGAGRRASVDGCDVRPRRAAGSSHPSAAPRSRFATSSSSKSSSPERDAWRRPGGGGHRLSDGARAIFGCARDSRRAS